MTKNSNFYFNFRWSSKNTHHVYQFHSTLKLLWPRKRVENWVKIVVFISRDDRQLFLAYVKAYLSSISLRNVKMGLQFIQKKRISMFYSSEFQVKESCVKSHCRIHVCQFHQSCAFWTRWNRFCLSHQSSKLEEWFACQQSFPTFHFHRNFFCQSHQSDQSRRSFVLGFACAGHQLHGCSNCRAKLCGQHRFGIFWRELNECWKNESLEEKDGKIWWRNLSVEKLNKLVWELKFF